MKLVSVIVPAYKVDKYLERCINSVLSQSYEQIELILVDDGSPDRCGEICDEFAEKDHRIQVIHKQNGGLSAARNVALDIAQGEYITFLDGDDMIHPRMLEWMIRELEETDADIVSTGLCSFSGEFPEIENDDNIQFERMTQKDFIDHLFPENFGKISVTACGKVYKKFLFNELRYPEGVIYEDLRIYLELLLKCDKISVVNRKLYYWYNNASSITRSNYLKHNRFGEFSVREGYISFFKERGLNDQVLLAANEYLTFFMRNYFAVMLRYSERKEVFKPHVEIFRSHLDLIQNNPYVCRMRKICSKLMLYMPHIAYILAKKTIPDCLIEEMR